MPTRTTERQLADGSAVAAGHDGDEVARRRQNRGDRRRRTRGGHRLAATWRPTTSYKADVAHRYAVHRGVTTFPSPVTIGQGWPQYVLHVTSTLSPVSAGRARWRRPAAAAVAAVAAVAAR